MAAYGRPGPPSGGAGGRRRRCRALDAGGPQDTCVRRRHRGVPTEKHVDNVLVMTHYHTAMTRSLTAAKVLRGLSSSSIGAYACRPGQPLDPEQLAGSRESADTGRPALRW